MSYILDALRKAERDRQVARVPTLATAHGGAFPSRRPPWAWAVVAGAVVLSAVALYAVVGGPPRSESPPSVPTARVAPPVPATSAPAPNAEADLARTAAKTPERSEPAPVIERPGASVAPGPARVGAVAPPAVTAPRAARVPDAQGGPSPTKRPAPGAGALAQAAPGLAAPAPPPAQPPTTQVPMTEGPAPRAPVAQAAPTPAPPAQTSPAQASPAPAPAMQAPPTQAPPAQAAPAQVPAQTPPALQTPPGLVLPAPPPGAQTDPNAGGDATAPLPGRARPGVDPGQNGGQPAASPPVPARLSLDVLVYSDVPAERMVFINGRKYVEGQTVGDDNGVIEQITPDGAVLRQGDKRVVLRPKLNPYSRPSP
jgi:hypothetical protein